MTDLRDETHAGLKTIKHEMKREALYRNGSTTVAAASAGPSDTPGIFGAPIMSPVVVILRVQALWLISLISSHGTTNEAKRRVGWN